MFVFREDFALHWLYIRLFKHESYHFFGEQFFVDVEVWRCIGTDLSLRFFAISSRPWTWYRLFYFVALERIETDSSRLFTSLILERLKEVSLTFKRFQTNLFSCFWRNTKILSPKFRRVIGYIGHWEHIKGKTTWNYLVSTWFEQPYLL